MCYRQLPTEIQESADRCFALLRGNFRHPSIQMKKVDPYWSARVGLHYRALAIEESGEFVWLGIGSHAEYDQLIRSGKP
jgi:hypothetical protein